MQVAGRAAAPPLQRRHTSSHGLTVLNEPGRRSDFLHSRPLTLSQTNFDKTEKQIDRPCLLCSMANPLLLSRFTSVSSWGWGWGEYRVHHLFRVRVRGWGDGHDILLILKRWWTRYSPHPEEVMDTIFSSSLPWRPHPHPPSRFEFAKFIFKSMNMKFDKRRRNFSVGHIDFNWSTFHFYLHEDWIFPCSLSILCKTKNFVKYLHRKNIEMDFRIYKWKYSLNDNQIKSMLFHRQIFKRFWQKENLFSHAHAAKKQQFALILTKTHRWQNRQEDIFNQHRFYSICRLVVLLIWCAHLCTSKYLLLALCSYSCKCLTIIRINITQLTKYWWLIEVLWAETF